MKSPKYLQPHNELTATQRKSLGLEKSPPRERAPGEATSIAICNSTVREPYRTGHGEVAQPTRSGAMRAMDIASFGVRT